MEFSELIVLAFGLAMDAFAVSICAGLSQKNISFKKMVTAGTYFGIAQGVMPLIGYVLGHLFSESNFVEEIDHWVAFLLLAFLGIKMIKESITAGDACDNISKMDFKTMFPKAIATSIDALAVGISLALLDVNILFAAMSIGVITFITSCGGVKIGYSFGIKLKSKAEIVGGAILVLIGANILLQHTILA